MRRRPSLVRAAWGMALILLVGSCAPTPKPAPPPPPAPVLPPVVAPPPPAPTAPPPAGDWDELPVVEGGWAYDMAVRRARFVDDSGLERASLTCIAPGRSIVLALAGESAGAMELLTSAGRSRHALSSGSVTLAATDGVLGRIAFSRGRFGLRGSTLMVLPVQSEIGRLIEDCRG